MGIADPRETVSVHDYLEGEKTSEVRHEYIGGRVYAMSGGSEAHNLLCGNLYTAIRNHLRGKPCKAFMADMKLRLRIAEEDNFYYPDVFVSCDPADNERYYKTEPVMIAEVLSPASERLDRREKFLSYTGLPTLEEYFLIDQERMRVTRFRREDAWKPKHFSEAGASVRLASLDFEMPLAEIYDEVPGFGGKSGAAAGSAAE